MGRLITRMVNKSLDIADVYRKQKFEIMSRYFGLFMSHWDIPELEHEVAEYVLKAFWEKGTIGAYKIPMTNELAFAPYAPYGNLIQYGIHNKFTLINEFGVSKRIVPNDVLKRNKDICIGFSHTTHLPIASIVEWQVDRIMNCRIAIENNLDLNKLAFILPP